MEIMLEIYNFVFQLSDINHANYLYMVMLSLY